MSTVVLGVGDYGVVKNPGDVIKTFALGSCVAVIFMDPVTRCVAMDHVALPDSATSIERSREKPGHFADTGLPATLEAMKRAGASSNVRGYIVKLVGGASVMDPNNTFNIGKRNILAIKKLLWKYGLGAVGEDVGGSISRTVSADVDTGRVVISSPGRDTWEI